MKLAILCAAILTAVGCADQPAAIETQSGALFTCNDADVIGPDLTYSNYSYNLVTLEQETWIGTLSLTHFGTRGFYHVVMGCPAELQPSCVYNGQPWNVDGYAQQNGDTNGSLLIYLPGEPNFSQPFEFHLQYAIGQTTQSITFVGEWYLGWNRWDTGHGMTGGVLSNGTSVLNGQRFVGSHIRCPAAPAQNFVAGYSATLQSVGHGMLSGISINITAQGGGYVNGQILQRVGGVNVWNPINGTTYSNNDLALFTAHSGDLYGAGPPNWFETSLASPVGSTPVQVAGPWYQGWGHVQPSGLPNPNFSAKSF